MKLFILFQFIILVAFTVGVFMMELAKYYHSNIIIMSILGIVIGFITSKYELKKKE